MNLYSWMSSKSAGVVRGEKEGAAKFLGGFNGKAEPCLTTSGAAGKEGVAKFSRLCRQGGTMPHSSGGVIEGIGSEPIT
jgi:hypothetical protein